jgi:periplasmic protein TonB
MRSRLSYSLLASTFVHGVALAAVTGLLVLPNLATKGRAQPREYWLEVAQAELPERLPTPPPEAPAELEEPEEEPLPTAREFELPVEPEPEPEMNFLRPELEPWPLARMTRPFTRAATRTEVAPLTPDVAESEPVQEASDQVPVGEPDPVEHKPVPVHTPRPRYPRRALERRVEGAVVCRITVACDGSVVEVKVDKSSGSALLDRAAMRGVKGWRFEPGTLGGRAVQMDLSWRLLFSLD